MIKNKFKYLVVIISLIGVILFLIIILLNKKLICPKQECQCDKETSENQIKDNYEYNGIYSYIETDFEKCNYETTLVLTHNNSAIFYVGDCHDKSYYYGKYRLDNNKIYLYSLSLNDTSNNEEMKVADDSIYFNLTDESDVITSIYGRSSSIRLQKIYNSV